MRSLIKSLDFSIHFVNSQVFRFNFLIVSWIKFELFNDLSLKYFSILSISF